MDLLPSLTCSSLPLGTKGKLYSVFVSNPMLHGSQTWRVKENDMIGSKEITQGWSGRCTMLEQSMKSMRVRLQSRLLRFYHIKRMDKCLTY